MSDKNYLDGFEDGVNAAINIADKRIRQLQNDRPKHIGAPERPRDEYDYMIQENGVIRGSLRKLLSP